MVASCPLPVLCTSLLVSRLPFSFHSEGVSADAPKVLDRSNLGNARLQGLPADTLHGDPTGVLFDWVTSAFYFSYVRQTTPLTSYFSCLMFGHVQILCQVPATVTMKLFPPKLWLGAAAIGWSICSTLMSTGFNFAGLMVCRIGLGVFEACFGPAIPLYFCESPFCINFGKPLKLFCSVLLHKTGTGSPDGLLVRVCGSRRCLRRTYRLWSAAHPFIRRGLATFIHYRGHSIVSFRRHGAYIPSEST